MADAPTPLTIEYTPPHGPRRRIRYEETREGHLRHVDVWAGCSWRHEGTEPVSDVVCDH